LVLLQGCMIVLSILYVASVTAYAHQVMLNFWYAGLVVVLLPSHCCRHRCCCCCCCSQIPNPAETFGNIIVDYFMLGTWHNCAYKPHE
jgi:hypothetical protein